MNGARSRSSPRYGDACSLRPGPEIAHKLDVLRRHCDEAGTDFDRIERTSAYEFRVDDNGPLTKALLEQLEGLADQGIDTVIGRVPDLEQRAPLEHLVNHVIPTANGFKGSDMERWRDESLPIGSRTRRFT